MRQLPPELNWMNIYDQLSNGDITKYNLIDDIPWVLCLNKMLLEYHRNEIIKEENKKLK